MKTLTQITAVATLFLMTIADANAGCLCAASPAFAFSTQCCGGGFGGMDGSGFGFGSGGDNPLIHRKHPLQLDGRRYPVLPGAGDAANHTNLVPVLPGTVGRTYVRKSHPLPRDKHPRTAMLAVRDRGAVSFMTTEKMSGFRMSEDVWLFESDIPLVTWTNGNIVRIEARHEVNDIEAYRAMYVRLIPGRIVYLDFE